MGGENYTPDEDARLDYLMDVRNMDAREARRIIDEERKGNVGAKATERLVAKPGASSRHYSRRGGRAFPEPSDSELDPHWNGTAQTPQVERTPENDAAFDEFAAQAREASIRAMVASGMSETEAIARDKAKREIRKR